MLTVRTLSQLVDITDVCSRSSQIALIELAANATLKRRRVVVVDVVVVNVVVVIVSLLVSGSEQVRRWYPVYRPVTESCAMNRHR